LDKPGQYILEVADLNGCYGKDTVVVYSKVCRTGVFIPNAFTPNADGLNDIFKAMVFGNVVNFRLDVYNRWENWFFSTTDPSKGWNGRSKVMKTAPRFFVWRCSYQLDGK
jgi:gliding motility-associated-like protein